MAKRSLVLALVGPTASGKSAFALEIAEALGGEIVSLDSTTVYQQFDIGSSKPSAEDRKRVPHHLLDILGPLEPFSAGQFVDKARDAIADILSRGRLPLVTGGTYFYLRALQHGMYPVPAVGEEILQALDAEFPDEDDERKGTLAMHAALAAQDPESGRKIHPNDRYRITRALAVLRATGEKPSALKAVPHPASQHWMWVKYAMCLSRHTLGDQIVRRTDAMLAGGLVAEVRRIRHEFPQAKALGTVGYAEVCRFLDQGTTEKDLRNDIIEKTRGLAKRQLTWIRSDPELRFVDHRDLPRIQKEVENLRYVLSKEIPCAQ